MENNKYTQIPPNPQKYRKLLETLRDKSGGFYRNYEGWDLDTNNPKFRRRRFSLDSKTPGRDRRAIEATLAAATLGLSTIPNLYVRSLEDEVAAGKIGTLREMAKALDVDGQKQHREQVLKQTTEDIAGALAYGSRPYTGRPLPYLNSDYYLNEARRYGKKGNDDGGNDYYRGAEEDAKKNRETIRNYIQDAKKSSASGEFMEKIKRNPIILQEAPELPEHLRFSEKLMEPLLADSYITSPYIGRFDYRNPANGQPSLHMPYKLRHKISFPERDISTTIHEELPYMSTLPGTGPAQGPSDNSKK